jgi:heat shock protein HtpX
MESDPMANTDDPSELLKGLNQRRAIQLMVGYGLVVGLVVFFVLAAFGLRFSALVVAIAVGVAGTVFMLSRSERWILRANSAKPLDDATQPRLANLLDSLCVAGGLVRPALAIIDDHAPNAFTVGRNPKKSTLVVTSGLIEAMSLIELEAVVARELSDIRQMDTRLATIAAATAGAPMLLADVGVWPLAVFAPISARLMRWAVSDQSDFLADITGVAMTRYPPGLIAALEKLRVENTVVGSVSLVTSPLWIQVPFETGEGSRVAGDRRFVTHPTLDERIAVLQEL